MKPQVYIAVTQDGPIVTIDITAPAARGKSTLAKLLEIEFTGGDYIVQNTDDTEGTLYTHQKVIKCLTSLHDNNVVINIKGYNSISDKVNDIIKGTTLVTNYNRSYVKGILSPVSHIVIMTTQSRLAVPTATNTPAPKMNTELYGTPLSTEIRLLFNNVKKEIPSGTFLDAETFCRYAIKNFLDTGKLVLPTPVSEPSPEPVTHTDLVNLEDTDVKDSAPATPTAIKRILGISDNVDAAYRLYELRMQLWQEACAGRMGKKSFIKFLKEGQEFIALGKLPTE